MRAGHGLVHYGHDLLRRRNDTQRRGEIFRVLCAVGVGNAYGLRFGGDDIFAVALHERVDRFAPAADLIHGDDPALLVSLEQRLDVQHRGDDRLGETEFDALYDLLSSLGVIPTNGSAFVRGVSAAKLVLSRRITMKQAMKLFHKDRRTDYESRVMRLAHQALLSTAEIIKCVEQDVFSLPSERVLMEKVYGDSETTCQNIASMMKNSRSSQAVTLAVANLYLRQQIIFERIST